MSSTNARSESVSLTRLLFGAGAVILLGLLLWFTPLGNRWTNASYDYLFRFGSRVSAQGVVLIVMDNQSRAEQRLEAGDAWPRELHTRLLNQLADDQCALVVLDVFFRTNRDLRVDGELADAIGRHRDRIVLAATQERTQISGLDGTQIILPMAQFQEAAGSHGCGVAWLTPGLDETVRQHWPFPSPGPHPSLAWVAAEKSGAKLSPDPAKRWLRFYGMDGAITRVSYRTALEKPSGWARGKTIFIGQMPSTPSPVDGEQDEFRTPHTRWTGESFGGVELIATQYLNLVNGDWLRRPHWVVEVLLATFLGALFGAGLQRFSGRTSLLAAVGVFFVVLMGAVLFTHLTHYWVPWTVVAFAQLPCALVLSLAQQRPKGPVLAETVRVAEETVEIPYTPDYQRVCKLGQGGFGEVWLVRNAIGQWQALKVVYRENFEEDRHYNYEFDGITKYKPVSERHQGLLRIELISQKRPEGYYYYVMELGDSRVPGWEHEPLLYKPKDLETIRPSGKRRLPPKECVRIVSVLADALHFLHQRGLTHRDIKPSNVIFVHGEPKLADVGLVTQARLPDKTATQVGTPGYMPPEPEPQGTVQADIYALGMVLYVISTGSKPQVFPELSKTLIEQSNSPDFLCLNPVILKACHPDRTQRYKTAAELHQALLAVQSQFGKAS